MSIFEPFPAVSRPKVSALLNAGARFGNPQMVAQARRSFALVSAAVVEKWPVAAIGVSLAVTALWAGALLWALYRVVL
jgi:hypothetical protein